MVKTIADVTSKSIVTSFVKIYRKDPLKFFLELGCYTVLCYIGGPPVSFPVVKFEQLGQLAVLYVLKLTLV